MTPLVILIGKTKDGLKKVVTIPQNSNSIKVMFARIVGNIISVFLRLYILGYGNN